MSPLKVLLYPDPFLKIKTSEVKNFGPELKNYMLRMAYTMFKHQGIGLAASQVGDGRNLFTMHVSPEHNSLEGSEESSTDGAEEESDPSADVQNESSDNWDEDRSDTDSGSESNESDLNAQLDSPHLKLIVNPEIIESGGKVSIEEGCLSLPGIREKVPRKATIRLRYQTPDGARMEEELNGLMAVCAQHEIDHLNGKLITDYLPALKRRIVLKKYEKELKKADYA